MSAQSATGGATVIGVDLATRPDKTVWLAWNGRQWSEVFGPIDCRRALRQPAILRELESSIGRLGERQKPMRIEAQQDFAATSFGSDSEHGITGLVEGHEKDIRNLRNSVEVIEQVGASIHESSSDPNCIFGTENARPTSPAGGDAQNDFPVVSSTDPAIVGAYNSHSPSPSDAAFDPKVAEADGGAMLPSVEGKHRD